MNPRTPQARTAASCTTYEYGARHRNLYCFVSGWESGSRTIGGDLTPPANPVGATATPLPAGYRVTWELPPDADYAATTVKESRSGVPAAEVGRLYGTFFDRTDLTDVVQRTVSIRHVDRSGNQSAEVSVMVTPEPPPGNGLTPKFIFTSSANGAVITGEANLSERAALEFSMRPLIVGKGEEVINRKNHAPVWCEGVSLAVLLSRQKFCRKCLHRDSPNG